MSAGSPEVGERPRLHALPSPPAPSEMLERLLRDLVFAAVGSGFLVARGLAGGVASAGEWLLRMGGNALQVAGIADRRRSPEWLQRSASRGRSELRSAGNAAADVTVDIAEGVIVEFLDRVDVDALLDGVDLNELMTKVLDQVDVSELMEAMLDKVDVAKTAELLLDRVDLVAVTDTMLERVDVVAISKSIIEGVELGELIRESSGTVAVETVDAIRVGGASADKALARLVDRLLRRRAERSLSLDGEQPAT